MATTSTSPALTSPFAALVNPALVQAAAERAAQLDLPKHRSTPWTVRDAEDDDETDERSDLN
jgi:hypothetical protein